MIDVSQFHFLRPGWLLALLPLLALLLSLRYLGRHQSGWQGVLAGHLYRHLVTDAATNKKRPPLSLLALGWLLATIALAGPTWERLPQPVFQLHTGKVVVMDMSLSMRATDVSPDRLTRARYKAMDLVNAIGEGETGLVAYAGEAFTISPLSSDAQTLNTLIPSLAPEIMPVPGSEPTEGLRQAIELLSNAGYQQGEIFWITDGVEPSQVAPITHLIGDTPFRLSILAVGSDEGAPIKLTNGELLKQSDGSIVIPRLDESNLKLLADKGNGRYARLQANDRDIEYLTSQELLSRETSEDQQQQAGDQWQEAGPYLLLLLLPIAAYGFRRGILSIFALSLLISPLLSKPVYASVWDDLWQRGDQQGAAAFANKDYEQAAKQFSDPMWQGSSLYKSGDFQGALDAFAKVDSPQAWYNQGNALAHLGEFDQAIAAYDKVLANEPDNEDAKANKALLEQMKKQQEQQQQQSSNSQPQQDQQGDKQEQQQDQQQQQGQQDGQQQSEQDQQQDGQQQQSEQDQQDQKAQEQEKQQPSEQQQDGEEQQQAQAQAEEAQSDEEAREEQQRLQNLLRKVPDDPAYLLKRKMLLENQQRRRHSLPNRIQRNW
ncbi:vWA domain-containing protein [Bowmanella yangjiangensis]|uniref:VWA domain-containing protein n=1 Tax=Bowmanella yangjiangensis TaxID=2811230 RepID=A0ABS3CPI2_9ALTE|nr:VWA domain-containing protein [Bowmanella yangjiangensis]MBN7818990.1 VWA domain-containing protein [Bowmanella yangjiangensis]